MAALSYGGPSPFMNATKKQSTQGWRAKFAMSIFSNSNSK